MAVSERVLHLLVAFEVTAIGRVLVVTLWRRCLIFLVVEVVGHRHDLDFNVVAGGRLARVLVVEEVHH